MIEIRHLTKTFPGTDHTVHALKDINITINDGDIYGIIGMSGAGKSTLVRCINMLERPTSGTVRIDGQDIGTLSDAKLRAVRHNVTMIFQGFNLLMQRTCLQNVCFPLEIMGVGKQEAEKQARSLLEIVGLPDKANAYPSQLSGGQQQRVAIARALSTKPKVLLCDEATSALDPKTTQSILNLIRDIHHKYGITVIMITHQMSVVEEICNRVAILDQGQVAEEGTVSDIFTHPKTPAAIRLVFPENMDSLVASENERIIRIVFDGRTTADMPLIAEMAIKEGIVANIKYASTKSISNKVYGNMLLGLPNEDAIVQRAIAFMSAANVVAEEVHVC